MEKDDIQSCEKAPTQLHIHEMIESKDIIWKMENVLGLQIIFGIKENKCSSDKYDK